MADDIRLEVRSDPKFLRPVRSLIRGWVEACDLPQEAADDMVLAIDEACTNAIRHSYGGDCDRFVELTLRADEDFLEVRLCDQGEPCPPEHLERRELAAPDPAELEPGGLGVQLIHRAFDEVEFCPGRDSGNCVIMRRKRGGG
jgi:anti-sigma regulatory factor (Ser/Thr protein kinase)